MYNYEMLFQPHHRRKALRLVKYSYSNAGGYFVTIVANQRDCLLGEIISGQIALSPFGKAIDSIWQNLPKHYPGVILDEITIMPNHIHAIIFLAETDRVGAGLRPAPTEPQNGVSLSEVVRALKSFSARKINQLLNTAGAVVWQRSYYDRVIRSEQELQNIRNYILENPIRWESDAENPINQSG